MTNFELYLNTTDSSLFSKVFTLFEDNYYDLTDALTALTIIEKFSFVVEVQNINEDTISSYFDLLFSFIEKVQIDKTTLGKQLSNYNNLLINYPKYFVEFLDKLYNLILANSIPQVVIENYLLSKNISHLFDYSIQDIRITQLLFLIKSDIYINKNDLKTLFSQLKECEISLSTIHLIISLALSDKNERIRFLNSFTEKKNNDDSDENDSDENIRFDDINNTFKPPIYQHIQNRQLYQKLLEICIEIITVHNNEYYFNSELENKEIFIKCYSFIFMLFKELIQLSPISKNTNEYALACKCFSSRYSLYSELSKYFLATYRDDIDILIKDILSILNTVLLNFDNPFIFEVLNDIDKEHYDLWETVFEKILACIFESKKGNDMNALLTSYIIENTANVFYFILNNLSDDNDGNNNIKIYFEKENKRNKFLEITKSTLQGSCLLYSSGFFKHVKYTYNDMISSITYKTIAELYFDILIKMYINFAYNQISLSKMLIDHIKNTFVLFDGSGNKYYMDNFKKGYCVFYLMDSNKVHKKVGIDKKKMSKLDLKLKPRMIEMVVHSYYFLLKILLCYIAFNNIDDLAEMFENMCLITAYNVFLFRKSKLTEFEKTVPKEMKWEDKRMLKMLGKQLDRFFISDFSTSISEEPLKELLFNELKVILKENFIPKRSNGNISNATDDLFTGSSGGSSGNNNNNNNNSNFNSHGINSMYSSNSSSVKSFEVKDDEYIKHLRQFISELTAYNDFIESKDIHNISPKLISNPLSRSYSRYISKSESNLSDKFNLDNLTKSNLGYNSNNNNNALFSSVISNSSTNNSNDKVICNSNNTSKRNSVQLLPRQKQYGNYFHVEKKYSFETIDGAYNIFYPKRQLLLNTFSLFFNKYFFHNDTFSEMKRHYIHLSPQLYSNKHTKVLNYPSTIKNYAHANEPPLFLKQDFSFFESPLFKISHPYFISKRNKLIHLHNIFKLNKIDLYPKPLPKLNKGNFKGVLISPYGNKYMNIIFESNAIILKEEVGRPFIEKKKYDYLFSEFHSFPVNHIDPQMITQLKNSIKYNNTLILFKEEIDFVVSRRYLHQWQAFEIFMKNGKSYFINLYTYSYATSFVSKLNTFKIKVISKQNLNEEFKNDTLKWNNNEINTFQYLMNVNNYGTRSYKDPNQYPILPWLLKDYAYIFTHSNITPLRDFSYPIICQDEEKRLNLKYKYEESFEDKKWACHYGSHYSTSAFVYYYLMRLYPFCNSLIKLQNYAQENTNRMLFSIQETQSILEGANDPRELVPEMFSNVNIMFNLNCTYYGKKRSGIYVDDIMFSDTLDYTDISLYVKFIIEHKRLINSDNVKNEIHKWIDYVFGYRQLQRESTSYVIFQKYSYEQFGNLYDKIEKYKKKFNNDDEIIKKKLIAKINIILNFGITPYQLYEDNKFKNRSEKKLSQIPPQTLINTLQKNEDTSIICFNIMQSNTNNNNNELSVCLMSTININFQPMIKLQLIQSVGQNKFKNDIKFTIKPFQHYTLDTIKSSFESNKSFIYFKNDNKYIFIITRFSDNTIHLIEIIQGKFKPVQNNKKYIVESFVTCICKGNNTDIFYTGMQNGKLIQWKLSFDKLTIKQIRSVYAQLSPISLICLYEKQHIIITSGTVYKNYYKIYERNADCNIYIRKEYDLELLTPIEINKKEQVICMKVSQFHFLYVLMYFSYQKVTTDKLKLEEKTKIVGYTLSGIKFAESCEGEYNNFCITENGNLIVCDDNNIKILCGACLNVKACEGSSYSKIIWFEYDKMSCSLYIFKEDKKWEVLDVEKIKLRECKCEKVILTTSE